MFKIRKLLRKLYYLLGFLSIFIIAFMPKVKAEEIEKCYENYMIDYEIIGGVYRYNGGTWQNQNNNETLYKTLKNKFDITVEEPMYIKFFNEPLNTNGIQLFYIYKQNASGSPIGYVQFTSNAFEGENNGIKFDYNLEENKIKIETTDVNVKSINIVFRTSNSANLPYNNILTGKLAYSRDNFSECNKIEPEEPSEEDEVYKNFLILYIDRINYLTEGFTNNPYLLAMIGIIFSFIVLELFLKILHLRGGK